MESTNGLIISSRALVRDGQADEGSTTTAGQTPRSHHLSPPIYHPSKGRHHILIKASPPRQRQHHQLTARTTLTKHLQASMKYVISIFPYKSIKIKYCRCLILLPSHLLLLLYSLLLVSMLVMLHPHANYTTDTEQQRKGNEAKDDECEEKLVESHDADGVHHTSHVLPHQPTIQPRQQSLLCMHDGFGIHHEVVFNGGEQGLHITIHVVEKGVCFALPLHEPSCYFASIPIIINCVPDGSLNTYHISGVK